MRNLRHRPIRQKITGVIMMIAGVVLLLAFAALFCFQAYTLKQHSAHELAVIGEITAHNCGAAVMFKDEDAAAQILGGLRTMPQIVSARLELANQQRLAFFGAARDETEIKAARLKSGFQIDGDRILLAQPVMLNGVREGTLYLLADLHATTSQLLKLYGGIFALVLVASLLVAFILSSQLLHIVTSPILRLAGTARTIADHNDYSVRATKVCGDEVGVLTDAFNQMLAQIESQDSALRKAEEKYRLIFENAIVGMYQTSPDGKYISVNPAMARICGYQSPSELVQSIKGIRDMYVDPSCRVKFTDAIETHGFVERFECEVYRKDRSTIWLSENAHAVRDAGGDVIYYEGTVHDITERKRAEEESHLLQSIALPIGQAKDVNAALGIVLQHVCEITGWSLGQAWIPRVGENVLECSAAWCNDGAGAEKFETLSRGFSFAPGIGLPGRVWASKNPAWVPDVTVDTNFPRAGAAREAGFKAGVAIPVLADEQVIAVVEFFVRGSRDEDERFVKLISSVMAQLGQIVQRKQAEDALHEMTLALGNAMPGISILNSEGRYERSNEAYAQMLGYSPGELISMDWMPTVDPEDRKNGSAAYQRMLLEGKAEFEARAVRKDGSLFYKHVLMVRRNDANGKLLGHYCFMQDITERKQAEEALRQAEQKYRSIFENAVEGIFQTTPAGRYISVNPALARMYGYRSPEELMGSVSDIGQSVYVNPQRRTEFKRLIERQGFVEAFEYEVYRKDRSKIWLSENARAARGEDGAVVYYEGSAEDITERKRVEEVERASKAKSEFLSRMSHELRTPLNAILGFGQLLERQNPTESQLSRIRHILTAGRHLLDLINEILDISRIEAGRIHLSLEPVCVADAVREAVDLIRPLSAEREMELSVPAHDESIYVMADRQRFKQVLLNLFTNAVKYTPRGGKVGISFALSPNGSIRVVVTDTGPGIPSDKISRLFTPFERLGAEQSTVEGTGLGLALSQRLVHAMHGAIGVESSVGQGSTFWVELPCATSPLERIASRNGVRTDRPRISKGERTILYVEDNLSNLTLVEQILMEDSQTELITAMQGRLALDLARQHSPDLILLDLHLPDMPGWEVLRELQQHDATREIPVVIVSADATSRQIKRLIAAGARAYLTKPIDVAEFFRVIEDNGFRKRTQHSPTAAAVNGNGS